MSSVRYQERLRGIRENATRIDTLYTLSYGGCYIHGGHYDDVHIVHVYFNWGIEFYSKSLHQAEKFINQMRTGFRL